VKLAASEAELTGLKALLAEVKANRDDLRQDSDDWRGRAERLLAGPQRQPWCGGSSDRSTTGIAAIQPQALFLRASLRLLVRS